MFPLCLRHDVQRHVTQKTQRTLIDDNIYKGSASCDWHETVSKKTSCERDLRVARVINFTTIGEKWHFSISLRVEQT